MRKMEKKHQPSLFREIKREGKRGGAVENLIQKARHIEDPYYGAKALCYLALMPGKGITHQRANELADEGVALVNEIDKDWRKAEALVDICKMTGQQKERKEHMLNNILDTIVNIPPGKALSDAIQGCTANIGSSRLKILFKVALQNAGYELNNLKKIIRAWAPHCNTQEKWKNIMEAANGIHDDLLRCKTLGYIHLQMKRVPGVEGIFFLKAIRDGLECRDRTLVKTFQYLITISTEIEELGTLEREIESMESAENSAPLLSSLGGAFHRNGEMERGIKLFRQGADRCRYITRAGNRTKTLINVGKGMARCNRMEEAKDIFLQALHHAKQEPRLEYRVKKVMEKYGMSPTKEGEGEGEGESEGEAGAEGKKERSENDLSIIEGKAKEDKKIGTPGRSNPEQHMPVTDILGLYNTYEGKFSEPHLRSVARAAPLCVAFGLGLALVNFPAMSARKIVESVSKETRIGKGGKYLRQLESEGRIFLIEGDKCAELGLPIATTSHPTAVKKNTMSGSLENATKEHDKKRGIVLMGLGNKGLPTSVLSSSQHHVEITGNDTPLETCSAMGIIAHMMGNYRKGIYR